jgi:hypothetical protein
MLQLHVSCGPFSCKRLSKSVDELLEAMRNIKNKKAADYNEKKM